MNLLWVDVETTGLDKHRHGIIQLAGMVELEGEIVETFDMRMNPEAEFDPAAQEIHGISQEQISHYATRQETFDRFVALLGRYVQPPDSRTKLYPAGYNVRFDFGFLEEWFRGMNGPPLRDYLHRRSVDPSIMIRAYQDYLGKERVPSWSLRSVGSQMGISLGNRHDALEDIKLTREIHCRLVGLFAEGSDSAMGESGEASARRDAP